mgnify:CR=1 FL=1
MSRFLCCFLLISFAIIFAASARAKAAKLQAELNKVKSKNKDKGGALAIKDTGKGKSKAKLDESPKSIFKGKGKSKNLDLDCSDYSGLSSGHESSKKKSKRCEERDLSGKGKGSKALPMKKLKEMNIQQVPARQPIHHRKLALDEPSEQKLIAYCKTVTCATD